MSEERILEEALRSLYQMLNLSIPSGIHQKYINKKLEEAGLEAEL